MNMTRAFALTNCGHAALARSVGTESSVVGSRIDNFQQDLGGRRLVRLSQAVAQSLSATTMPRFAISIG